LEKYSPNIMAMIAALPGLRIMSAVHENRKDGNGPNMWLRYAWEDPFKGMALPNSAYDAAPVQANSHAQSQTTSDMSTDPACELTCPGDAKIPDPI
jgi:hypothetical protein